MSTLSTTQTQVMDAAELGRTLRRLSHEIVERRDNLGNAVLVAIEHGGVDLTLLISAHIEEITEKSIFDPLINRSGLNCKILKGGAVRVGDIVRNA